MSPDKVMENYNIWINSKRAVITEGSSGSSLPAGRDSMGQVKK
jgi:hypothetical protein